MFLFPRWQNFYKIIANSLIIPEMVLKEKYTGRFGLSSNMGNTLQSK